MKVLIYRDKKKPFTDYEERYYRNIKNLVSQINKDEVVDEIEDEYDIAHFISLKFKNVLLKVKKERKCPIVVTYDIIKRTKLEIDDPSEVKISSDDVKLLNQVNLVIALSQSDKFVMVNNGVETPIEVIGGGTKPQKFYEMNELELKAFSQYASLNKTDSYAISVINYKCIKDVQMIIDLAREFKNIKFFIFTKKIRLFKMPHKSYALLKRPPVNVKCIYMMDEDLYKSALMNASYFIVPYDTSATSMIIFDAMITRTPIFSIYSQAIDDILFHKHNAYISFNTEQMIQNIKDYINGDLPSLLDKAYKYAKGDSFEIVASKIKEAYQRLI